MYLMVANNPLIDQLRVVGEIAELGAIDLGLRSVRPDNDPELERYRQIATQVVRLMPWFELSEWACRCFAANALREYVMNSMERQMQEGF